MQFDTLDSPKLKAGDYAVVQRADEKISVVRIVKIAGLDRHFHFADSTGHWFNRYVTVFVGSRTGAQDLARSLRLLQAKWAKVDKDIARARGKVFRALLKKARRAS